MDYSMPQMNGPDSTRAIRQFLNDRGVPRNNQPFICLLTAYQDVSYQNLSIESGMDACAMKPIFKNELTKILAKTTLLDWQKYFSLQILKK